MVQTSLRRDGDLTSGAIKVFFFEGRQNFIRVLRKSPPNTYVTRRIAISKEWL